MQNLNFKIVLDSQKSKRSKDDNGYLIVKDNPIALSGVYDYLLSEVSDSKSDEVVKVCREFDDLKANKDLFKDKPIIWQHYWTGEQGDNQRVDGAITGDIEAKNGGLYADLIIYNSDLIKSIENGECYELSPGYECEILQENGSYNGEHYDYKQLLKNVNHLAVVEQGRTGHELRIQDKGISMDKKISIKALFDTIKKIVDTDGEQVAEAEVKDNEVKTEAEVKEVKDDKITAIFEIMASDLSDDEKKAKIAELLAEKTADECGTKDNLAEIEVEAKEPMNGEVLAEISADDLMKMIEKVTDSKIKKLVDDYKSDTDKMYKVIDEVKSVVGKFDISGLNTESEVYAKGFEIFTGAKLADGLDSKTAFKMEVEKRRPKTQTAVNDEKTESNLSKMAKRFK